MNVPVIYLRKFFIAFVSLIQFIEDLYQIIIPHFQFTFNNLSFFLTYFLYLKCKNWKNDCIPFVLPFRSSLQSFQRTIYRRIRSNGSPIEIFNYINSRGQAGSRVFRFIFLVRVTSSLTLPRGVDLRFI